MNKFPNYASFEKTCVKCEKSKHIKNFKRSGLTCKICNDCNPPDRKILCERCKQEKHRTAFQMDSKMRQPCNKCRIDVAQTGQDAFNKGFNILNILQRKNSVHANKQMEN